MYQEYIVKYYSTDGQVIHFRVTALSGIDARRTAESQNNYKSYISVELIK